VYFESTSEERKQRCRIEPVLLPPLTVAILPKAKCRDSTRQSGGAATERFEKAFGLPVTIGWATPAAVAAG